MNKTEASDFYRLLRFLFGPRRPGEPETTITQASVATSRLAERAHNALQTGRRDFEVVELFERLRPSVTAVRPPIAALTYGLAPDVYEHEDLITAQQLWQAIREQLDPNDAWTVDEVGPLLRTLLAVLTERRAEQHRDAAAVRRLVVVDADDDELALDLVQLPEGSLT